MRDDRREEVYAAHFEAIALKRDGDDVSAERLLVELLLTCDIASEAVARLLSGLGLSRATFNVLMLLRHGPADGMQLHEIGELLLVSRANITGLINHLETRGYVTRVVPSNDRRVRQALITPKAEAIIDALMPLHTQNVRMLLSGLNTEEVGSLRKGLAKVRVSLHEHEKKCRPLGGLEETAALQHHPLEFDQALTRAKA